MRAGIVCVVLLVTSGSWACGGGADDDPPGTPDSGGDDVPFQDASVDPLDSGIPTAGLVLRFGSDPLLPGPLGGDPHGAFIDEMRVELQDLRAVGDSETGENTTRPALSLRWGGSGGGDVRGGGPGSGDIEVRFPTAPPGYYSLIKADIMSYRARGDVEVEGGAEFEIDDTPPTPISISIPLEDFLLEDGTSRTVDIHCSLHEAVGDVPWDTIDPGEDDLEIETGDPEIAPVRAAMGRSFTAVVLDQIE